LDPEVTVKGAYSTVTLLLEISVDAMQMQDLLPIWTSLGPVEEVKNE
jgi:hypothetical protein